jgi:hypothetical protein
MAYSVNWGTRVITIPKADTTLVSVSPDVRSLDINDLWVALRDIQDDEAGIDYPDIFLNIAPVTLAGLTLARVLQIINGYTLTFEDGLYAVNIIGGNSNVSDVTNKNQVSVNTANSAGLVVVEGASNLTAADVWSYALEGAFSAEELIRIMVSALAGKVSGAEGTAIVIRDLLDSKNRISATVDSNGNRTAVTLDGS